MKSMRRRLLLWLLTGQVLAVLLAGVITFVQVRHEVEELVDDQLRQIAASLDRLDFNLTRPVTPATVKETFHVQVWQEERLLFDSHPALGLPRRPSAGLSSHIQGELSQRSFLLVDGERAIQVTQSVDDELEETLEVVFASLGPMLGLIPVLAVLVWFGVGYGMRPLVKITAAIACRRSDSMQPLPLSSQPREVFPLVAALNALLGRLDQALESQRKFVADAAHELRTPLTAVQLQAQLLERAENDGERQLALTGIRAGTERAAHLVQQLLTLARLAPEGGTASLTAVDFGLLCREVVAEYAPLALRAGIDLGVTRLAPVIIQGDVDGLRVMLGNLIDNAIRYTPDGGQVDVAVDSLDRFVVCEVQDTGPGIPVTEQKRVFDRFYRRLGSGVEGSGLGLSIVHEVVTRSGGTVALAVADGGQGLKVTVRLPQS